MKVRELLARLANADPDAIVLVYPQYADYIDGGELGEVLLPEALWIHETGTSSGSKYVAFYPGEAEARDESYSAVEARPVRVVLLGEELSNFRHTEWGPAAPVPWSKDDAAIVDLDEFESNALPWRRQLVRDGALVPVATLPEDIRERLSRELSSGAIAATLFTVDVDGVDYLPAFLLSSRPPEVGAVAVLLRDRPSWSKFHFFTSANASLGGVTPLEALRAGDVERVRRAANAFAER